MGRDHPHIAEAAALLLDRGFGDDVVGAALALVGRGAGVDRVYVFENFLADDGELCCRQRYEWCGPAVVPQLDNPALQAVRYGEVFPAWREFFERGDVLCGPVDTLEPRLRPLLEAQAIRSILLCPITLDGRWWGFVGFDDCQRARVWAVDEVDQLRRLARAMAGALRHEALQARAEIIRAQLRELLRRETRWSAR